MAAFQKQRGRQETGTLTKYISKEKIIKEKRWTTIKKQCKWKDMCEKKEMNNKKHVTWKEIEIRGLEMKRNVNNVVMLVDRGHSWRCDCKCNRACRHDLRWLQQGTRGVQRCENYTLCNRDHWHFRHTTGLSGPLVWPVVDGRLITFTLSELKDGTFQRVRHFHQLGLRLAVVCFRTGRSTVSQRGTQCCCDALSSVICTMYSTEIFFSFAFFTPTTLATNFGSGYKVHQTLESVLVPCMRALSLCFVTVGSALTPSWSPLVNDEAELWLHPFRILRSLVVLTCLLHISTMAGSLERFFSVFIRFSIAHPPARVNVGERMKEKERERRALLSFFGSFESFWCQAWCACGARVFLPFFVPWENFQCVDLTLCMVREVASNAPAHVIISFRDGASSPASMSTSKQTNNAATTRDFESAWRKSISVKTRKMVNNAWARQRQEKTLVGRIAILMWQSFVIYGVEAKDWSNHLVAVCLSVCFFRVRLCLFVSVCVCLRVSVRLLRSIVPYLIHQFVFNFFVDTHLFFVKKTLSVYSRQKAERPNFLVFSICFSLLVSIKV